MKNHYSSYFQNRCLLVFFCAYIISIQSVAAPVSDETESFAPSFSADILQPVHPAACARQADADFVQNTNIPIIANCAGTLVTITGVSRSNKVESTEKTTHVLIHLARERKKPVFAELPLMDFPAEFVDAVEFADLNGDGETDIILNLSSHGNGLAAEIGGLLFLLSNASGYQYLAIDGVMNSVPRFVRLVNSPSAVFVLQRLANSQSGRHALRGRDGKSHTFFIFDLLQFDTSVPSGIKLNNRLDPRFPFWTLFTDTPTHAETILLSRQSKRSLWHDPLKKAVYGRLFER